jgi:hypothetical protein
MAQVAGPIEELAREPTPAASPVATVEPAAEPDVAPDGAVLPPSLDLLRVRARLQSPADRELDQLRATLEDGFRVAYPNEDLDVLLTRARRAGARLAEPDTGPRHARELARSLLTIRDVLARRGAAVDDPLFAAHPRWKAIADAPLPPDPVAQPPPARAAPSRPPRPARAVPDPKASPEPDLPAPELALSPGAVPDPDTAAVERTRAARIYASGEVAGGRTLAAGTTVGQLAALHGILLPDRLAATTLLARTDKILFVTSRAYTLTPAGAPVPGAEQAIPVTNGLPAAGTYFLAAIGGRDVTFVRLDDGPRVVAGDLFFDAFAARRVGGGLARSLGAAPPQESARTGPSDHADKDLSSTTGPKKQPTRPPGRGVLVIVSPSAYPDGPNYVRPGSARLNAAVFTDRLYGGLWNAIKTAAARRRDRLGETVLNVFQQAAVGAVASRLLGLSAAFGAQFGAEVGAAIADIRGVVRDAVSEEEIDLFAAVVIPKIGDQLVEQLVGLVGTTAVTTVAGAGLRSAVRRREAARQRRIAEERGPITAEEAREILDPGSTARPKPDPNAPPGAPPPPANPIAAPVLRERGWKAFIESLPPDERPIWWHRRELVLRQLEREGLTDLVPVGSTKPTSDRDVNSLGPDSHAKITRALEILKKTLGLDEEQLSVALLLNFLTDPRRAHMYTDPRLPAVARERLRREHTEQVLAREEEATAARRELGAQTGLDKAAGRDTPAPDLARQADRAAKNRQLDELSKRYEANPDVETASEIQRLQLELNVRNPEAYFAGPAINRYASRGLGIGQRFQSLGEGLLDLLNQRAEFSKQIAKATGYLIGEGNARPSAAEVYAQAAKDYTVSKYAFREFLEFERFGLSVEPALRRIAQKTQNAKGIALPPEQHAAYIADLIRAQETLLSLARERARNPTRFAEAQYVARQVVADALGSIGRIVDVLRPGEGFWSGLLVHPGVVTVLQELHAAELRAEPNATPRAAPAPP